MKDVASFIFTGYLREELAHVRVDVIDEVFRFLAELFLLFLDLLVARPLLCHLTNSPT